MPEIISSLSSHLYSVYFAPRGYARMMSLGRQLAQEYLSPFDLLVGIVGEAGSGKSMLVKGMFPGLELTNDDNGINVRPLPLLEVRPDNFRNAHTYHVDIRFESAFTQIHQLAEAITHALSLGLRVVVEHFELIYPFIQRNANLLIGVGREIIITRPNLFGPEPDDIASIVFQSIRYRKMAHTAEDLCELCLADRYNTGAYTHGDIRYGFTLGFNERPEIDIRELQNRVLEMIAKDLPVSYSDDSHVIIGDSLHPCTGPRTHVDSTGEVENFTLLPDIMKDPISGKFLLAGLVGGKSGGGGVDFNRIILND